MTTETARKRILIVDDEKEFVDATADYLRSLGYEPLVARTAEEALKVVERQFPDLILLDIILPEMKGVEVCNNLKANLATRHIPILFVTAIGTGEHIQVLLNMGADGYLIKPCKAEELRDRIKSCLQHQDSQSGG